MDPLQYGLWYAEGRIPAPDHQNAPLSAKEAPHRIPTQAPKLCHFTDAVMPLAVRHQRQHRGLQGRLSLPHFGLPFFKCAQISHVHLPHQLSKARQAFVGTKTPTVLFDRRCGPDELSSATESFASTYTAGTSCFDLVKPVLGLQRLVARNPLSST